MSKGKNNNKNNNKSNKVPVKTQPMKQQKPAVNKFVKEIKPNQVNSKAVAKTNGKQQVEVTKKVEKKDNKAPKVKEIVKVVDIAESEDDEDEDDVDFEDMGDSDIDDVSVSDDDEDVDSEDDDEDLSIEDIDNSDYESVELNEDILEKESEEEEVEIPKKLSKKEKKELAKKLAEIKEDVKVEKKEVAKVEKKEVAKVEKKEVAKVEKKEEAKVEKKEVAKVEKKETKEEVKIIDPSTPEGKVLTEMNQRKNFLNDYVIFVGKLDKTITRQSLLDLLASLSVVHINLPHRTKNKQMINRGYGFVRLASTNDVTKAIEILTAKDIHATKFVCKKVFDDVNKVDFNKLVVNSFQNEDISELLKSKFDESVKIIKYMTTQYAMEFTNASDAMALFNKNKMTIDGKEVQFTFFYGQKSIKPDNTVPEPSATLPMRTETVKAGVKRATCDSDEEEEVVVKKSKVADEGEVPRVVATPKKAANKPVQKTPENKKPVEKTTPKEEKKSVTPNKQFNKGGDKKSPGNNKQFHKGGDKKSPGNNKQFNKGGNKKPFNKK